MPNDSYLSKERYEELQKELEYLKNDKRKEVAERLKQAKEYGDLSENAEYAEAKEEKQQVEQEINELTELLRTAKIIKKKKSDEVHIGSTVTVQRGQNTHEYTIVGSNEADPTENKISNESPIGKALLGHKKGDEVRVETPGGGAIFTIKKVS